ncbi:MAG TPA: glycosyltransferase [Chitinophagaceae bacterium]|nr:glycosyltransferase [Chitinophagaceae bacterium]
MKEIAVVLPVYNGMKYLSLAVESVLRQTHTDFIFLICDDCSKDGSWDYLNSIKDPRVSLFRNEVNRGLFPTLNFLCRKADAKIIKLWSQDDIMNPECLAETVAFHRKYPHISFSYSDREHIDENGRHGASADLEDHTPEYIPRQLHDKIALFTGSIAGNIANVAIVKDKLEEAGYFDEGMIIAGDFDMWVKLTENYDTGRIPKPLIQLRDHSGQLSRSFEYYIRHIKEEKKVFSALFARVNGELRKFGKNNLRWRKNPLYFSFMLQAARRGKWGFVKEFSKELSEHDNLLGIAYRWSVIKLRKIFGIKLHKDNKFLFKERSQLN